MLWLALVVFAGSFAPAWANGSLDQAKPAPTIEQLIERLGSKDFRLRDAANKALGDRGMEVLPALRKARTHKDPEVRRRVEALLAPLEAAALVLPKRVTLHLKQRPIREAVTELAKQTGYKIELWPEAQFNGDREKQPYSFDLDKVVFWEALDRIAISGGLVLQQVWGSDVIRLQFEDSQVPYVTHNGMFRVSAQSFNYNRTIQLGAIPRNGPVPVPQQNDSLNLTFLVASEPRLPLLGIGQVKVGEAVDDQGNSLILSADRQNMFGHFISYGYNRSYSLQGQVTLAGPGRSARKVKLLRGAIPVTLLQEQKPLLTVEPILKAKGKKVRSGNAEMTIEDVTKNNDGNYQIKMRVSEPRKDAGNDYTWSNTLYQRIELLDAKGNKFQSFGFGGSFGVTEVNGTFTFGANGNAVGAPTKLVYYQWITIQHHVLFEFKDLPLP
jgi:hypothetical protein